ncbi:MAG: condensation domain-containing protein, partial [Microcystis panniformis]
MINQVNLLLSRCRNFDNRPIIRPLKNLLLEAACEPFDLESGSVLRVKLWQLQTEEYVLLLAIHHIAADGWSIGVLVDELSVYYRSFC